MSIHRRCPASLIPWAHHNPQFIDLMHQKVSSRMISYIAERAARIIQIEEPSIDPAGSTTALPTPPHTPHKSSFSGHEQPRATPAPQLISLEDFITHLVLCSNVQVPTLLTTLIYLQRLKAKLPAMALGALCPSLHRPRLILSLPQACPARAIAFSSHV
jgi:G1/S-specific cyclin PLC1